MAKHTLFDQNAITNAAWSAGLTQLINGKPYYFDPKYVAVADDKAKAFMSRLATQTFNLLVEWKSDFKDCDKFSRLLQSIGIASHALQWADRGEGNNAGLGLGVLNYTSNTAGRHSINVLLTKPTGKVSLKLRFYEPQTGEELMLTSTEKRSADLLLL